MAEKKPRKQKELTPEQRAEKESSAAATRANKEAEEAAVAVELVRSALARLATDPTGEVKLNAKDGQADGLLPAKGTDAKRRARQECVEGDPPLMTVVKRGQTEFARLTLSGLHRAIDLLPTADVGGAVLRYLERVPRSEGGVVARAVMAKVPESVRELGPYVERAEREEMEEERRRAKDRANQAVAEEEAVKAMHRFIAWAAEKKAARIAALEAELEQLRGKRLEPAGTAAPPAGAVLPEPATQKENDFRKAVATLLVQNSRSLPTEQRDARRYFDAVLFNLPGVRRIGKAGEVVPFHPADHASATEVEKDAPVKVLEPGWMLRDELTTQILAQALVAPAG